MKGASIAAVVVVLTALVAVAYWFWVSKDNEVSSEITIGLVSFPGYAAFYVARDEGFFKEVGLDVVLKQYSSLADLSRDYTQEVLHGRANLAFDAVLESLGGFEHRVVSVIDYSSGADGILAGVSIGSLQDLAGKRVAYEQGTLEEFFLASLLKRVSLSIEDVTAVNADPEEAVRKLSVGEVDAAVTYEPFLSNGAQDTSNHVLVSTADAPGLVTDVLTFRSDVVDERPDEIRALLRAYFKALAFMADNPNRAAEIVGREFQISPIEANAQLKGVNILNAQEVMESMGPGDTGMSIYLHLDDIQQFLVHTQAMQRRMNTDTLVDPTFIRAME